MKSFLGDINVWVALAYDRQVHHELVLRWFASSAEHCLVFCRISHLGLLRLLTNSAVMGGDVRSQQEAWTVYDRIRTDSRVAFVAESDALEPRFRQLTHSSHPATKHWSDAYLAALALTSGLAVVTLDRAFPRVSGLEVLCLTTAR